MGDITEKKGIMNLSYGTHFAVGKMNMSQPANPKPITRYSFNRGKGTDLSFVVPCLGYTLGMDGKKNLSLKYQYNRYSMVL